MATAASSSGLSLLCIGFEIPTDFVELVPEVLVVVSVLSGVVAGVEPSPIIGLGGGGCNTLHHLPALHNGSSGG